MPRNLIAAWLPLAGALAVCFASPAAGRLRVVAATAFCLFGLAIVLAVDVTPRLQRADWRSVATALGPPQAERILVAPHLGVLPLELYLRGTREMRAGNARVREIDLIDWAPLRRRSLRPPAPGFWLYARRRLDTLVLIRFRAPRTVAVTRRSLGSIRSNSRHDLVLVS